MTHDKATLERRAEEIYNRHFKEHFEWGWPAIANAGGAIHAICLSLAADFLSQQPQDNLPAASAS